MPGYTDVLAQIMIKALDRKWLLHNLPNLFTGEWYSWTDNQGDGSIKKTWKHEHGIGWQRDDASSSIKQLW